MKRIILSISLVLIPLLGACAPQMVTPTVTAMPTQTPLKATTLPEIAPPDYAPTLDPAVTGTPGLLFLGYTLTEDGKGIGGAAICQSYASYPGVLAAVSDENGYFQADFAYIPGDEMVTVWAIADGYVFEPQEVYWRHYGGFEQHKMRFVGAKSTLKSGLQDCR